MSLILILVLCTTAALAQDVRPPRGPRLVMGKSRIAPGDVITLPVTIREAPNIGAVQLDFVYDARSVQLQSVEKGRLLGEMATLTTEITSPGRAVVRISTTGQPIAGDGELFKVRVTVPDDAPQAGHRLLLENATATRVAKSQGDGNADASALRLAVHPGTLRVIDGPVPMWVLGAIGLIILVVTIQSVRKPRGRTVPRLVFSSGKPASKTPAVRERLLDGDLVVEHARAD